MCEMRKFSYMKEEDIVKNYCGLNDCKHAKRVVELCEIFATEMGINNNGLLIRAACLHDIGKIVKGKHDKKKTIKQALKKVEYAPEDIEDVIYIIKYHKRKDFEPKRLKLECSILRICDKLAKFYKPKIKEHKAIKSCEKSMEKIRKLLCDDKKILNDFEQIYSTIKDKNRKINNNSSFKFEY